MSTRYHPFYPDLTARASPGTGHRYPIPWQNNGCHPRTTGKPAQRTENMKFRSTCGSRAIFSSSTRVPACTYPGSLKTRFPTYSPPSLPLQYATLLPSNILDSTAIVKKSPPCPLPTTDDQPPTTARPDVVDGSHHNKKIHPAR